MKIKVFTLASLAFVTSVAMGQVINPDQQGNGQANSSSMLAAPQVNTTTPFYVSGPAISWQRFSFQEALASGRYRDGRFQNLNGSLARQEKYLKMVQDGTAKKVQLSFPSVISMWHGGASTNRKATLVPEGASAFVHPTPVRVERYYKPIPGDASRYWVEEWSFWRYLAHEYCGNPGEGLVINVKRIPVTMLTQTQVRVEYTERVVYVDRPVVQTVTVPGQPQQELIWTAVTSRNQTQISGVTRFSISYGNCWIGGGGSSISGGDPSVYCPPTNPISLGTAPPANLPPLTGPNAIQNGGLDPALGGAGIGGGGGPGPGGTPISIPPPPR